MAERLLQPPEDVTAEARHLAGQAEAGVDRDRLAWIASGGQVGRSTLLALLASGVSGRLGTWATRTYARMADAERDSEVRALTAAAVESDGRYFGILNGGDLITAVVRASAGERLQRWFPDGWHDVPEGLEPVGLPYRELSGDLLADALVACAAGQALMLRPTNPRAFLKQRVPLTASAGRIDGVYAAVDEVDTTAVLDLIRVDGAHSWLRRDGAWTYDSDGATLPYLLASAAPLALVPDPDLPPLLRAFDDHQAVFPLLADTGPGTGPTVAGTAVRAGDTGRVLMLQRAMNPTTCPGCGAGVQFDPQDGWQHSDGSIGCHDDSGTSAQDHLGTDYDPAAGDWEFPGGHLEAGEDPLTGGLREWCEETGMQVPDDAEHTGTWTSPDGVYQGNVLTVPGEDSIDLHNDRGTVINPDDPDGDQTESIAWVEPEDLPGNPSIRAELLRDLAVVIPALTGQPADQAITGDDTGDGDDEALVAAHPYPGQRYRHGWIPVAGFNPGAYHQRRHATGGHVEIGARGGHGIKSIGEVHNRPAGGFTAKHMYKGETHETHHATEGEARSAVIRGHEAHQAEHGPADASEAFRMPGSDLKRHAAGGNTVAQAEVDRRAAKRGGSKPAAKAETKAEPEKPASPAHQPFDAGSTPHEDLRPGDTFDSGRGPRVKVLSGPEPHTNHIGQNLSRYLARREDTGKVGHMDFGPGGRVAGHERGEPPTADELAKAHADMAAGAKAATPAKAKAKVSVRPGQYQGEAGHHVTGTDTQGRKVGVFVPGERGEADKAAENIRGGRPAFHKAPEPEPVKAPEPKAEPPAPSDSGGGKQLQYGKGEARGSEQGPEHNAKPYWAMSKDEYERAAGPGKRWVYHASEDPHAFDQGVKMANVPRNLARQRYEAGEDTEFAPGAGLGNGVYVGDEAHNVDGYGHYLHAFKVPMENLAVPPEAQGYRPDDVEHHLKQSGTGALLTHDTPASDVVNMGRIRNNGFTGHEVHQLNALREGLPVPEKNLSPRLKAYRDRYLSKDATS